jgi:hypothetical protein
MHGKSWLAVFGLVASMAVGVAAPAPPPGPRRTGPPAKKVPPMLVTDRSKERTGFQEASPLRPPYDLRTDFVMAYGLGRGVAERLEQWRRAGYVPHVMTGVAWGHYQDYLDGKVDGRAHWDEGQVDAAGKPILHGPRVPYMVPAVSFSDYLQVGLKRVIDAGAVAVHLEEPEFWARAGFSEAFRREWRIYYHEPWRRPDRTCDAQYRASKLKWHLYRRALDRLCSALKEYALARHGRAVRFYVPTHSLLNYTQWGIVSPESGLIDLPGIDGCVAQVWTGTARTPNVYRGRTRERTFETAYLEYSTMQELVRGTGRRMWFLHDPIEDNPRHDWDDYRRNYVGTLVASLLHPGVSRYEVAPWPRRVFEGRYPARSADARPIPPEYATVLAVAFNQLRDMEQADVSWPEASGGVGVFLADSAMFQRAEPAFSTGVAARAGDPTRPTAREVRTFSGFYGLALPLLKRGIPLRVVQLDNVARFPGYLDAFQVLLLSYEFLKPQSPGLHLALAQWVQRGGTLVYVGADTDPFHEVRDWWRRPPKPYAAAGEHLFESLGLGRRPAEGEHRCGKGLAIIERKHPAWFTRSAEAAERLARLVRRGLTAAGGRYVERNSLVLRRGPYVIAAVMDESVRDEPLRLRGRFVDLLDAALPVRTEVRLEPGRQAWLLDLDRVAARRPAALAAAGRIESWQAAARSVRCVLTTMAGVGVSVRLALPAEPKAVTVDGKPCGRVEWHGPSGTVLIRYAGGTQPAELVVSW